MNHAEFNAGQQVEVLVPKPFAHGFDYRVPDGMAIRTGDYVQVPFGRQTLWGVVWGEGKQDVPKDKVKDILLRAEEVASMPETFRHFLDWVSAYTLSPLGMVLKMALPNEDALAPPKRVMKTTPIPDSVPEALPVGPKLSDAQADAANQMREKLAKGFSVTLMDGVTGSGKTEVYFDVIADLLQNSSKQILVMLPEIALSTQWVARFQKRFGFAPIVWHSGITPAKRREAWKQIANGKARLVVGARSSLFLPYADLGLVVVDEEHDASYKQEEGVLYHARDMAIARGMKEGFAVLLASATPALETVQNVESGKYDCVHLPKRHGEAVLPKVHLVDMRTEQPDRGKWISPSLRSAMVQALEAGKQTLLFLNRRGYAPLLLCRGCGHRFACSDCSSWLVVHQSGKRLQCHHCGHSEKLPETCPSCSAEKEKLVPCGPGVERVMEEVSEAFPNARVAMMASDTTTSLNEAQETVTAMTDGKIDILIGTQMVAKGYHFPKLHLIGVVDADLGLAGGDLRAVERTYQLLHQVAGRAGRENEQGEVYLQTALPDHPVMKALAAYDRSGLEKLELEERKDGGFPPFGRLAALILDGTKEQEVIEAGRIIARAFPASDEVRMLGPAPAPISRLRGKYRYRFLVKSSTAKPLQPLLVSLLSGVKIKPSVRVRVDIDPYSFF